MLDRFKTRRFTFRSGAIISYLCDAVIHVSLKNGKTDRTARRYHAAHSNAHQGAGPDANV